MMEIQIKASRLKHVLSVLGRFGSEAVFVINEGEIASRVIGVENSMMVKVSVKGYVHVDEAHSVEVDLDKLWSFVTRAKGGDEIDIVGDGIETWNVSRGIHSRSFGLLDVGMLRKCPKVPELSHDAVVTLTGKEFKEIVAEAGEVDKCVVFRADKDGMTFSAEGFDKKPYVGTLSSDRVKSQGEVVRCLYAVEKLEDIVVDMRVNDDVTLRFSRDLPCEIEYERRGVEVCFMLAPRIEID